MDENEIRLAFARTLAEMPPQRRIATLALLAHNLTIGVRGIRADQLLDSEAVEKLYAVNEAQHTITARVMNLVAKQDRWDEDAFVNALFESARHGRSEAELIYAISYTLSAA